MDNKIVLKINFSMDLINKTIKKYSSYFNEFLSLQVINFF